MLQKKPSVLKKRTSSTSKLKIFLLFLWIIFALLDPDPDSESGSGYGWIQWPAWIRIQSGSGSRSRKTAWNGSRSGNRKAKAAVTLPAGEYESCATLGQIQRGLKAQSHIRARDDNHLQFKKPDIFVLIYRSVHDILVWIRNPDPAIFVIDLQDANKKTFFSCLLLFEGTFKSFFKDKKSKRSHKTVGIKVFLKIFAWW